MCSVVVHHGFHLNIGPKVFEKLSPKQKRRQLARYDLFDDLSLVVPSDTWRALAGLGCLMKKVPTGFRVFAEVADPDSPGPFAPVRTPAGQFRLRFVFITRQPFFWNYTNLELGSGDKGIYYVSNLAGLMGGTFPDLSAPASDYRAGTKYRAGDIVRTQPSIDSTYLAVRDGVLPAPLSDEDPNWQKLANHTYVSGSDRIPIRSPSFSIRVPPTVEIEKAELIDNNGKAFGAKIKGMAQGPKQTELFIDAEQIQPGRYTLRLSGSGGGASDLPLISPLYLDAELSAQSVFAIVELFHTPDKGLGDFRLYDKDETIGLILRDPEPEFFVRLLNRHTFWRYRFPEQPSDGGDVPEPGDHLKKVDDKNWYVTKKAMPLTSSFEELVPFNSNAEEPLLLPNPSVSHIVPEPDDRVYSDIHLPLQPK